MTDLARSRRRPVTEAATAHPVSGVPRQRSAALAPSGVARANGRSPHGETATCGGPFRTPGARRLHHFFEATTERAPDNVALQDDDNRVSYQELNERANQLAHVLRGRGVARGTRVGILLHRSVQTYVSLLAVLKAGAAFVPIDPGSPRDRVAWIT